MGPIHGRLQKKYRDETWRSFFAGMAVLLVLAAVVLAIWAPTS
jgi:type II secretory pathway component PulM